MDEYSAEIFIINVIAVIQGFDVRLLKKFDHLLFKHPASLSGNDLHKRNPLFRGVMDHPVELLFDHVPFVKNIMKIQFEFRHSCLPYYDDEKTFRRNLFFRI